MIKYPSLGEQIRVVYNDLDDRAGLRVYVQISQKYTHTRAHTQSGICTCTSYQRGIVTGSHGRKGTNGVRGRIGAGGGDGDGNGVGGENWDMSIDGDGDGAGRRTMV